MQAVWLQSPTCNHKTIPLPRHCAGILCLQPYTQSFLCLPLGFRRLTSMHHAIWAPLPSAWRLGVVNGRRTIRREKGRDVYAHTLPIPSHPHSSTSRGWVLWWQCLCKSGNIISTPCPAGLGVVTLPHCYLALDGPQSLCSGYPCSYLCKLSLPFLSCWHLFRFQTSVSALTFPSGHEPSAGITRACEFHSRSISSILFFPSIPTALS